MNLLSLLIVAILSLSPLSQGQRSRPPEVTDFQVKEGTTIYHGRTDGGMVPSMGQTTIIKRGEGGLIVQSLHLMQRIINKDLRLVIDGPCYSACTFFLALPQANMCYTRSARFYFHSAYIEQDGKVLIEDQDNIVIAGLFGPISQAWFVVSHAYRTTRFTMMPPHILEADYADKKCPDTT